jgi:hypothetical protein
MLNKIKYPAITFPTKGKDKYITVIRSGKDLTDSYSKPLKNGFYNDLKIVDINGLCYTVLSADKIGYRGFFGFILSDIKVKLNFDESIGEISLIDFKSLIFKYIELSLDLWTAADNLPQIHRFIKSAKSHEEIINYLNDLWS